MLGRRHRIISVIVDGEPNDSERPCFPPPLCFEVGPDGALTDKREEPVAADARPGCDGKELAKLKVVAGLLGLDLDEIVRRAQRAHQKRVRNWSAALVLLTVTFAGLAAWAEINRREARRETIRARQNLSSALNALALKEVEQRPVTAAKLAMAAWPRPGAMDMAKSETTLSAVSHSLSGLHERIRLVTKGPIASVAFSSDGARVLTGSYDKTICLWDAVTGQEIRSFAGHEGAVTSVAFSPDGTYVLSGSQDKTARLWHASTRKELRAFKGHERHVRRLQPRWRTRDDRISGQDRSRMGCGNGNGIRCFEGEHDDIVVSVAFSPDGTRALTGSNDQTARLWDASTAEKIHVFKGHKGTVTSVVFSPDGARALTGSNDKTASLLDAETGQEIRTFETHEYQVWSVAFSPDGARVLTGLYDGTACLWDAATGQEIRIFKGHEKSVAAALMARVC